MSAFILEGKMSLDVKQKKYVLCFDLCGELTPTQA